MTTTNQQTIAGTVKYVTALGQDTDDDGTPFSSLANTCVTVRNDKIEFTLTGERAEAFHFMVPDTTTTVRLRGGFRGDTFVVDTFDVDGQPQHVFSLDRVDPVATSSSLDLQQLYDQPDASPPERPLDPHQPAGDHERVALQKRTTGEPEVPPSRTTGEPTPTTSDTPEVPPSEPEDSTTTGGRRERPVHRRTITDGVLVI